MTVSARLALVMFLLSSASCATLTFAQEDAAADAAAEAGADVGCTADTNTDPMNCGACGRVCATPRGTTRNTCEMGVCVPVCASQFGSCDGNPTNGCEAELNTEDHCGACETVCLSSQVCRPPPPPDTAGALRCVMCGRRGIACCQAPNQCEAGLRCDGMNCVM